jgi:hypothetical protein
MSLLWIAAARADAIMPGPAICPPGFAHTIRDHAEVCAFDPMTVLIEGGVLVLVIGVVVVIAAVAGRKKG